MGYYSEGRRESIAYFLAIIMTLGAISPSLPFGPDDAIPNPFSCVDIEGAIIEKEHDDEGHKLYVELYGVANLDSWNGYIVSVSNKTYTDYEVGLGIASSGPNGKEGLIAPKVIMMAKK